MTLRKKIETGAVFSMVPVKIGLLKKVVSSLQYLSGTPHNDFEND